VQRLRICNHLIKNMASLDSNAKDEHLEYLRIEDNGTILAVFSDDSEIDISKLFPQTILEDYKEHHILEQC